MRSYLDIPLTLILSTVLTVAMLWPINQPIPAPDGTDQFVHLITFAALSFPLARTGRIGLVPVFVGASAFGVIIEIIQPSFGRSADMQDWIADIVGVTLGIAIALLYRKLRKHRD
jgi:VanZ family protein